MFSKKIRCEVCGSKVKHSVSLYRRGSRFCSATCVGRWIESNPPLRAKGAPEGLRDEAEVLVVAALQELARLLGRPPVGELAPSAATQLAMQAIGALGKFNRIHAAEQQSEAIYHLQSYTAQVVPLLWALDIQGAAVALESIEVDTLISDSLTWGRAEKKLVSLGDILASVLPMLGER